MENQSGTVRKKKHLKNQSEIVKYHKNQPETMKNHKNPPGTMKKNENRPPGHSLRK